MLLKKLKTKYHHIISFKLKERLKDYPDDLIVEAGFNPTFVGKDKKVVIEEPQFEIATKYDDQGCKIYKFLRIF